MRHFIPNTLGGQLLILLVAIVLVLQGVSLYAWSLQLQGAQITIARDVTPNVFRLLPAKLLSLPSDLRADVLRAMSTPSRVLLLEDRPAVRPGDKQDPERAAELLALLRRIDSPVDAVEVGERAIFLPGGPPGPGMRSGPLPLSGISGDSLVPVRDRFLLGDSLPVWVRQENGSTELTDEDRIPSTAFLFGARLVGDGRWLNVYSMIPPYHPGAILLPAIASAIGAIVLAGFATLIGWRLMRPFRTIAQTADGLGRGERVDPVPLAGTHDVREIILAFNRMSERVNRAIDHQAALLGSVAHDLKGPLAAIRYFSRAVEPVASREKIESRLDQADVLVSSVMAFTRSTLHDGEKERVDLSALVGDLIIDYRDQGHAIAVDLAPGVEIECRVNPVERAVRNLIDNALKYGALPHVRVERDETMAIIEVDDEGPGLPAETLEQIFEPFHRVDNGRETEGHGLGLAIVKSIVVDHGGTVVAAGRPEGGLRFTIKLPL